MPLPVSAADGIQGRLEEVTVTARKRTESFQDVPITMTVFNEVEIESAGIERVGDFIALTPNATVVQVQSSGNTFISVRGISQNRNTEPSVAYIVDGVMLSQPSQFNQELFDIEQIEFLKGPQGALYGRNAIGGAITITTKQPTDELEGMFRTGIDDGFGYKVQGMLSGPVPGLDDLKFRGSLSWYDTDGWIENTFLGEDSDPVQDLSGRLKLLWEPTDDFTADLRVSFSQFEGQGFNYRIAQTGTGPFAPFGPHNANLILPIRVNNAGINHKDLWGISLKLDFDTDYGTFTSITAYDDIDEINTGDSFDFLPIADSVFLAVGVPFTCDDQLTGGFIVGGTAFPGGCDLSQSQYFDIQTFAQEIRFTSPQEKRFRWGTGAYFIWTDRFVSTTNLIDIGQGVFPVFETPRTGAVSPSATFLSDSQDNFAWAVFGDVTLDVTDDFEVGLSLRYDHDKRENTTETPDAFLFFPINTVTFNGEVREKTWSSMQPKLTLRYHVNDDHTIYSSVARGFRSGGFNQAGVGADVAAVADNIKGTFDEEVADTVELGMKSSWFDGRLASNIALFKTRAEGSYYFRFLVQSSTQNLGSLDEVEFEGFEIETAALVTDNLSINAALGMIHSDIRKNPTIAGENVVGNQVPGVSEYTVNLGAQYHQPLNNIYPGLAGFIRTDYSIVGKTYWEPNNLTNRRPYDLLNLRFGLDYQDEMTLTFWSTNLLDEQYNAEYSAGGFVYRAQPRHLGVDFQLRF